jgi:hypothetical protein
LQNFSSFESSRSLIGILSKQRHPDPLTSPRKKNVTNKKNYPMKYVGDTPQKLLTQFSFLVQFFCDNCIHQKTFTPSSVFHERMLKYKNFEKYKLPNFQKIQVLKIRQKYFLSRAKNC